MSSSISNASHFLKMEPNVSIRYMMGALQVALDIPAVNDSTIMRRFKVGDKFPDGAVFE